MDNRIATSTSPLIVAEIGCNHRGEMATAEELIKMAAFFCKADYAKFQKRNPKELLSPEAFNAPHPNPMHAYGETYGAHREFLELDIDQHKQLVEWCEKYGIKYGCSVWDMTSAREIVSLDCDYVKIPSASNTHSEMLRYLCDEHKGLLHISMGMTTREERDNLFELLEGKGRLKDAVIYKCTSGYPVSFDDCHLLEIGDYVRDFGDRVAGIGFSGHHLGIAIDNAAYALGARWFERHFTLDRTWKGTDHAASLEPDGLRRLCRDLRATARAMTPRPSEILEVEKPQREKLKWLRK
jgi:sialic acid synthase